LESNVNENTKLPESVAAANAVLRGMFTSAYLKKTDLSNKQPDDTP
jgi:hypothetical protein